jgi:hypothetical protein
MDKAQKPNNSESESPGLTERRFVTNKYLLQTHSDD